MMGAFIRCLQSEFYKLRRSLLFPIHFGVPVITASLFLLYFWAVDRRAESQITGYIQLIAVAFPLMAATVLSISLDQEAKAGDYQGLFLPSMAKSGAHLAKLITLWTWGGIACMLTVLGFGLVYLRLGRGGLTTIDYAFMTLLLWITSLPYYLLTYLIDLSLGREAAVASGLVGSLLSALLLTGLGDGLWGNLPWGIPVRCASIFLEAMFQSKEKTSHGLLTNYGWSFLFISLLLFGIFILYTGRWESKGKK
ncbi:MAG: lantibiotic immunity ABC transporter MutG family permease subunit [Tissierellia bacterium]|nr:lantibiotic immunity ABC transporter MutG family permease subunit [Tissierellia bacterium]